MRVRVIEKYNDRQKGKVMVPNGPDSEFEVSKERGKLLISKGFVEEVKVKPKKKSEEEKEVEPAEKE